MSTPTPDSTPPQPSPLPSPSPDLPADPIDPGTESQALSDWKDSLREEFESWLDTISDLPESPEPLVEEPDLYSFYRELAAANTEARKGNRKTAEAFSQWGETLSKFDAELKLLREQIAQQPPPPTNELPRPWCLVFIEMVDRLERLSQAFQSTPPKRWYLRDDAWRTAWDSQRQAVGILLSHARDSLRRAGLERIQTQGQIFDPTFMTAVARESNTELPNHTVMEELSAGYRLQGDVLRAAEVRVSTRLK
jgi:molecular chaperone GrpE (heat shock protein)